MPTGYGSGSRATQFKPLSEPLDVRFMRSWIGEPNSGCWIWTENCDDKGYGRITKNKKFVLAHRVSWELFNGPTTKFILHRCDNSACVNPEHLYAGTQADNMRDRQQRNKDWASKGEQHSRHKLTEQQVLEIRKDTRSQANIAKNYGISQSAVWAIKNRKKWKHI